MNDHANHHAWMQAALKAAHEALPLDVPVGAVLVRDGEIIARACNRRERDNNPVGHAEMLALQEGARRLGNWRLSGTTLYVTLEPCPMCAAAIAQARVSVLVYGADDPLLGACGSRYNLLADGPDVSVLGGVMTDACGETLRTFFRERRR